MGFRMSSAWYYLTGMVGFRHAEAGLRELPRGVCMVLFVRDGGPPLRRGRPPWASACRSHGMMCQGLWASATRRPASAGLRAWLAWYDLLRMVGLRLAEAGFRRRGLLAPALPAAVSRGPSARARQPL